MSASLYDLAAAALRAGDMDAARDLFGRAAAEGERKAAVIHTNFLASGVGGPREWPTALQRMRDLAASGRRSAEELALIGRMALDSEGSPLSLPPAELLSGSPHILRFARLFSREECAYLRDAAAPMLAPSVVVDPKTGEQRPDPLRTSSVAGFAAPLENPALHALNRRIAAASGTAPEQGEPLQILRYDVGGEYRVHFDAIPGFRNQRILTMLVWLNDGFVGGKTYFPATKLTLSGALGDAILFRNTGADGRQDPTSAHAGLPVRAGEKWLASRWIRERPFDYSDPR